MYRTVFDHDGVTDIIIEREEEKENGHESDGSYRFGNDSVTLRLRSPIVNSKDHLVALDATYQKYWLQNDKSRITILLSEPIKLSGKQDGLIDVPIVVASSSPKHLSSKSSVLRIRLIVEDVDTFHKGANEYENFFGTYMTDDFFIPLELRSSTSSSKTTMAVT